MGLPPTMTKSGLVWDDPKIRTATQLLRSTGTLKARRLTLPSATIVLRAAGVPLTINSTGTSRELPRRARSISQYGPWS